MIGALITAGGMYLAGAALTAWWVCASKPWNAQHLQHHSDGRFETFRDHPWRNIGAVVLNSLVWPVLWASILRKELR